MDKICILSNSVELEQISQNNHVSINNDKNTEISPVKINELAKFVSLSDKTDLSYFKKLMTKYFIWNIKLVKQKK